MDDGIMDLEAWAAVSAFVDACGSTPTARQLSEWQARHPAHADHLADVAEVIRLGAAGRIRDAVDHDAEVDEALLASVVAASRLLGRMSTGRDPDDDRPTCGNVRRGRR